MSTVAIEAVVDTSDLDMLDGLRHSACGLCYPQHLAFGDKFIATCGREVIASGRSDWLTPPNACRECEQLRYGDCRRCGA